MRRPADAVTCKRCGGTGRTGPSKAVAFTQIPVGRRKSFQFTLNRATTKHGAAKCPVCKGKGWHKP